MIIINNGVPIPIISRYSDTDKTRPLSADTTNWRRLEYCNSSMKG